MRSVVDLVGPYLRVQVDRKRKRKQTVQAGELSVLWFFSVLLFSTIFPSPYMGVASNPVVSLLEDGMVAQPQLQTEVINGAARQVCIQSWASLMKVE